MCSFVTHGIRKGCSKRLINEDGKNTEYTRTGENGTDVPMDNVSRETSLGAIYTKQQKKKPDLDKVRKKGNITDDDPFDSDNPTAKVLYRSFRQNGLSRAESAFNALYLRCYDNYYSSGVPVKNKYKHIYAHPSSWFKNANHMLKHNKWSIAVKLLEILPTVSKFIKNLTSKKNSAADGMVKSIEDSRGSGRRAVNLLVSLISMVGIAFAVFFFQNGAKAYEKVPALSLYIDGRFVGEVLSISDVETAKNNVEDALSVNFGSSYKLNCTIEYKATAISTGSNLTQARLSRALGEVAHKQMKDGYGLYANDLLIAVSDNHEILENAKNDYIDRLVGENEEGVASTGLEIKGRQTYPESHFKTEDEIRKLLSLAKDTGGESGEVVAQDEHPADSILVSNDTTLLPSNAGSDASLSSDVSDDDTNEQLLHQITIEAVIAKTETREEIIPYSTEYVAYDENLLETVEKVVSEGKNGKKTASYLVEYVGDIEISRRVINETIITEPVTKKVIKGTRALSDEEKRVKSTGTYIYPNAGEESSQYGWRTWDSYNEFHKGLDMRSDKGLKIVAADGGEIIQAHDEKNGYGICVQILHDDGTITRYAHCSKVADGIKVGTKVAQGDHIAEMGDTGWSTGVHLHFEMIKDGETVNPKDYLIPRD